MGPEPFDLNLRHLRALAAIVADGNMSTAARSVGLSQPAMTQGLAKLERQLGTVLFDRRPDGMAATAEGLLFAARVEAAFQHLATGLRSGAREQRMTATQLRAVLHLADAGSYVLAAETSGISQSALHRAVADLGHLAGAPLVERRGRGVSLTALGRQVARGARLAEREIAAAIAESHPDTRGAGRIVVGAMPLSRAKLLPAAIAALTRVAPQTSVDVVEGSWRELVEPLRDGVVDLMIGALRPSLPGDLVQHELFVDRLVVVGGVDHPLAGVAEPTLDQLAQHPWIVGRVQAPLRAHWDALFEGRPLPRAPIECGSVMTIRGILRSTDCLTLLSPDQIDLELSHGLLAVIGKPLERHRRTIGITTRAAWRPTPAQAQFLALLHAAAAPKTSGK